MSIFGKFKHNLLLMVSLIVVLTGCDAPDPLCVLSDDFGDLLRKRVVVAADKDEWVDSGVEVQPNKPLQIKTFGSVDLCASNTSQSYIFEPSPRNGNWQNTGFKVEKGAGFAITVEGEYSAWQGGSCSGESDYWDEDCWSREGRGIYAYIGDEPPDSGWYGDPTHSSDPNFFELYDRENNFAGFSALDEATAGEIEGTVYLRYRNTSLSDTSPWKNNYSDNRGGYSVLISGFSSSCRGIYGEYMHASIGETPGTGAIINLHEYAQEDDTVDPPREAGLFNEHGPAAGGNLWFKIIDDSSIDWNGDGVPRGDDDYTEYVRTGSGSNAVSRGSNTGSYTIDVKTFKKTDDTFSKFVNKIIDPVREFLLGDPDAEPPVDGMTQTMYRAITFDGDFIQAVRAAMVLAIVFFAFQYMVGLSQITQKEFTILVLKLGIVTAVISPTSWETFNIFIFNFFIQGTDDLIWIMSSQLTEAFSGVVDAGATVNGVTNNYIWDESTQSWVAQSEALIESTAAQYEGRAASGDVFNFLNETISRFFTEEVNIKLVGLMSGFPIGFILAVLIYFGMAIFLYAVGKAILLYLIAIIMTSLLLLLAPLMITFILFRRTKEIFDRWIKQLISYAMQPVLLFAVLAIFNVFIFTTFYFLLSFSVCWQCIFEIDFPLSEMLGVSLDFDEVCIIYGYEPWGMDSEQSVGVKLSKTPVGLFMALIFIILVNAMLKFTDWIVEVANTLTAGVAGVALGSATKGAIAEAQASVKSVGGAAVDTASAAAKYGDKATGHVVSDQAKQTARRAAPRFLTKGESDGMGGKTRYSSKFMTSTEKKGLKREQEAFNKLSKKDRSFVYAANHAKQEQMKRMTHEDRSAERKAIQQRRQQMGKLSSDDARELRKVQENSMKNSRKMYEAMYKDKKMHKNGKPDKLKQRRELIKSKDRLNADTDGFLSLSKDDRKDMIQSLKARRKDKRMNEGVAARNKIKNAPNKLAGKMGLGNKDEDEDKK